MRIGLLRVGVLCFAVSAFGGCATGPRRAAIDWQRLLDGRGAEFRPYDYAPVLLEEDVAILRGMAELPVGAAVVDGLQFVGHAANEASVLVARCASWECPAFIGVLDGDGGSFLVTNCAVSEFGTPTAPRESALCAWRIPAGLQELVHRALDHEDRVEPWTREFGWSGDSVVTLHTARHGRVVRSILPFFDFGADRREFSISGHEDLIGAEVAAGAIGELWSAACPSLF